MASSKFSLAEGRPTWTLRMEESIDLEAGDNFTEFHLFYYPSTALLSWAVTIGESSDSPLVVHHVFDLANSRDVAFLDAVAERGALTLGCGGADASSIEQDIDGPELATTLRQGRGYLARLSAVDGASEVRLFLDAFNPVFRRSGYRAAWEEVGRQMGLQGAFKGKESPATAFSTAIEDAPEEEVQTSRSTSLRRKPDISAQTPLSSGTDLHSGPFDKLLSAARPELYRQNAFRVAQLPVDCSGKELKKRQQLIQMALDTQAPVPPGSCRLLALDDVDPEHVRGAISRLQDPVERAIDELFWFWPTTPGGAGEDALFQAFKQERVKEGAELLRRSARAGDAVAAHNLAVFCHATALDLESPEGTRVLTYAKPEEAGAYWKDAYEMWGMVLRTPACWERLVARIAALEDPRVQPRDASRMRLTLPSMLLALSAQLAVRAAQAGHQAATDLHLDAMRAPGYDESQAEQALVKATSSLRDRLQGLCASVEKELGEDPDAGDKVAERLIEQTAPLIAALDLLLPGDNVIRSTAHDDVALGARPAIIRFHNVKNGRGENKHLDAMIDLLRRLMALAESDSAKERFREDIAFIENMLAEREQLKHYLQCWFCRKTEPDVDASVIVKMYGNVTHKPSLEGVKVGWQAREIKVPRCPRCQIEHEKSDASWAGAGSKMAVIVGIVSALTLFMTSQVWTGKDAGGGYVGLGCGGIIACAVLSAIGGWIGRVVFNMRKPKDVRGLDHQASFPFIAAALKESWAIGEKPPGVI